MVLFNFRDIYATKFGLPLSARYKHDKEVVKRFVKEVLHQHPGLDRLEAEGRALARLDYQEFQRLKSRTLISITKKHNWRVWVEVGVIAALLLAVIVLSAKMAHGQVDAVRVSASGVQQKQWAGGIAKFDFGSGLVVDCVSTFGTCKVTATGSGPGGGITTLNGLTTDPQTFAKVNDTNVTLTIGSVTSTHTFTLGWSGSLAVGRGGTGSAANTGSAGKVLIGNGSGAFIEGDPLVQGVVAAGASLAAIAPVYIGGVDGSGNSKGLVLDASGRPTVNVNGTVPVSGTVTASGPVTDTQLRASAVPVSLTSTTITGTVSATQSGTWTVQPGNTANTTAWKVDGSAVTQPVSGTVTTSPPANASTNIAQINGITPLMGSGNTGTGSLRVTLATDQPNLTTALNVNCTAGCTAGGSFADSSAFTFGTTAVGNMSAVVDDVATNTVAENSAGAVRMNGSRILYVDLSKTAANTNKLLVTPDSVALPANQSVNVSQINAVTPLMGNGITGTGSQRVTIASDNTAFSVNAAATLAAETTKVIGTARILGNGGATLDAATSQNVAPPTNGLMILGEFNTTPTTITTGNASPLQLDSLGKTLTRDAASSATAAAVPASAAYIGGAGSGSTGGNLVGVPVGDTYKNINVSTATTTLLVTGVSGRQVRISALHMITTLANNVALIEGTGATCGTGTAGMAGGTTAASGYNLAANGGIAFGSGLGTVMQTATTGDSVCVVTSAATQLSGGLQYTIY